MAAGRRVAQARKVEHIIRNMHGTIGQRNRSGHDPRLWAGGHWWAAGPLPPSRSARAAGTGVPAATALRGGCVRAEVGWLPQRRVLA